MRKIIWRRTNLMASFVVALFLRRWSLAGLFTNRDGPKDK